MVAFFVIRSQASNLTYPDKASNFLKTFRDIAVQMVMMDITHCLKA